MDWVNSEDKVTTSTYINGVKYQMIFHDNWSHWFVSLSSGKKRRDLDIYENKEFKSRNGYEVVNWCLNCLKEFPYKGRVIVKWADVRRRKIYGHFLIPLGFRLVRFDHELYYFKKYE